MALYFVLQIKVTEQDKIGAETEKARSEKDTMSQHKNSGKTNLLPAKVELLMDRYKIACFICLLHMPAHRER
jgi:hypothetical protein